MLRKLVVFHSILHSTLKEQQFQENFYHRRREYGSIPPQQLNAVENFQSSKPCKYYSYHNYLLQGITALAFISILKLMNVIRKGSVSQGSSCWCATQLLQFHQHQPSIGLNCWIFKLPLNLLFWFPHRYSQCKQTAHGPLLSGSPYQRLPQPGLCAPAFPLQPCRSRCLTCAAGAAATQELPSHRRCQLHPAPSGCVSIHTSHRIQLKEFGDLFLLDSRYQTG